MKTCSVVHRAIWKIAGTKGNNQGDKEPRQTLGPRSEGLDRTNERRKYPPHVDTSEVGPLRAPLAGSERTSCSQAGEAPAADD